MKTDSFYQEADADLAKEDFDSRLFAPKDYIDAFDLINGDYKP